VLSAISILCRDFLPNYVLFAYCFYLGAFLPKLLSNHAGVVLLGRGEGVVISLTLLVLVEFLYQSGRLWLGYKYVADALISAHLISFVLLRPDSSPAHILDHRGLVWLGDVSYSFYCYAFAVLIVTASALLMIVPEAWSNDLIATAVDLGAGVSCVTIALAIAHFSFEWVEKPCMAIGRTWSDRIELGRIIRMPIVPSA
jgi:peptidoglycan/LPS O-acetylase OafA/YrhL